ncbi:MerR family transcriptional regulator [Streptomyces sp. NBC_01262]|uniref:MerR family transcriptional regulator n=1 Tax=Streptomyces sp. NBC_01262 TaxID=2903803 RepID=UPI002E32C8E9|nr:MerR family transcriptional regulator [Streptomyces sp. NBC_01262]
MATEYRMEELAAAAGIPLRTVRFYRERKLLPPPRREGRIAWYDEHHLARLRTITGLLARGHTLGGIAQLLAAAESGRDVAEVLGLDAALATPWSEESPVRLTPEAMADYFADQATADNLATALDIGYLAVDGDDLVHISRRLLEASSALVREGIPLADVLASGRAMRTRLDSLAALFIDLARAHVLPDTDLGEAIARLRPLVRDIVEAELALAMDRALREELDRA